MAARKVELVARFDVPAKSAFGRRPEHEIWRDFGADRVSLHARPVRTNPRGTNAHHEFHFLRDVPRFLEQKVRFPFRGMPGKLWRNSDQIGRASCRERV